MQESSMNCLIFASHQIFGLKHDSPCKDYMTNRQPDSASACASAASSPLTSVNTCRFPRAGRATTMTSQPSARAAWSFSAVPPATPLSLVTSTPAPKSRMCRRFSSTENGPRPAMICSGLNAGPATGIQRLRVVEYADHQGAGRSARPLDVRAEDSSFRWSATRAGHGETRPLRQPRGPAQAPRPERLPRWLPGEESASRGCLCRRRPGWPPRGSRSRRDGLHRRSREWRDDRQVPRGRARPAGRNGPRCWGVRARCQRNIGRLRNQHAIAGLRPDARAIGGASLVPPRSKIIRSFPS